jgi:hypothetical protein
LDSEKRGESQLLEKSHFQNNPREWNGRCRRCHLLFIVSSVRSVTALEAGTSELSAMIISWAEMRVLTRRTAIKHIFLKETQCMMHIQGIN